MAKTPDQPALEEAAEPERDLAEELDQLKAQLGTIAVDLVVELREARRRENVAEHALAEARRPRTLDERIAAVQLELEDVPRAGHAVVQTRSGGEYSYDYITEADLMKAIRPLLAKHGIASYYSDQLVSLENGVAVVKVTLTFAANGEERVLTAEGVGTDTGDKHANKAKTSAMRYLLWKTFLQPSDEDPEQENVPADAAAAAASARKPAPARPAARSGQPSRGRVLERVSTLAVELDEVQGRPPGATLGEIPELIRAALEDETVEYPAGITDAQLVDLANRLQRHIGDERRRVESEGDTYQPATLKLRD